MKKCTLSIPTKYNYIHTLAHPFTAMMHGPAHSTAEPRCAVSASDRRPPAHVTSTMAGDATSSEASASATSSGCGGLLGQEGMARGSPKTSARGFMWESRMRALRRCKQTERLRRMWAPAALAISLARLPHALETIFFLIIILFIYLFFSPGNLQFIKN